MLLRCATLLVGFTLTAAFPTRQQRLSLADWGSYSFRDHKGPGTYAFGYDIEDPSTNNVQFRQEERHSNGSVTGSYGHVEADGNVRITHYIADHLGYRAREERRTNRPMQTQTTTTPSSIQADVPLFEGEFFPNFEINNQEDPIVINDKQPPALSPASSVQFPPVYDDPNQQNHFSNDVSHTFSHFPNQNRNVRPLLHTQAIFLKPKMTPGFSSSGLVFQSPSGMNGGVLKFRLRNKE